MGTRCGKVSVYRKTRAELEREVINFEVVIDSYLILLDGYTTHKLGNHSIFYVWENP